MSAEATGVVCNEPRFEADTCMQACGSEGRSVCYNQREELLFWERRPVN